MQSVERLARAWPANHVDAHELFTCLEDLQRIGIVLVDNVLRWRRASDRSAQLADLAPAAARAARRRSRCAQCAAPECTKVHVTTSRHEYKAFDFEFRGGNYLAKMARDLDCADSLFQACRSPSSSAHASGNSTFPAVVRVSGLLHNPLVLAWSLDELEARVDALALRCPESELWKTLDPSASAAEVQAYQAALVVAREERSCASRFAPASRPALELDAYDMDAEALKLELSQLPGPDGSVSQSSFETRLARQRARDAYVPIGSDILRRKARIEALAAAQASAAAAELARVRSHSATVVQALARGHLVRVAERDLARKVALCTALQARLRGHLARERVSALLQGARDEAVVRPLKRWLSTAESAALVLQTWARRELARRSVQRLRESTRATALAAWWRCLRGRRRHLAFLGARRVQREARRWLARRLLARLRLAWRQRRGATAMQAVVRRARARHLLSVLRCTRAVTRLQTAQRAFAQRLWLRRTYAARRVQVAARRWLVRRAVVLHRRRVRAAVLVQRWRRFRQADMEAAARVHLARWRQQHVSEGRKFALARFGTRYLHMCSLYDHRRRLVRLLRTLRRTSAAARALRRLNARLARELRRAHDYAYGQADAAPPLQVLALQRVKRRYERLLCLTKHLPREQLAARERELGAQLAQVDRKVAIVEALVVAAFRAADLRRRTASVVVKDLARAVGQALADPVPLECFSPVFDRAAARRRTLEARELDEARAEMRVDAALREAEWTHAAAARTLDREGEQTKLDVRKSEARSCAAQIAAFVGGKGLAIAARRRVNAELEARLARELQERWDAMVAEDRYAEAARPYLATASGAQVTRAIDAFDAAARGRVSVSIPQAQRLAFDLGIAVPQSKIRLRNQGLLRVELPRFLVWLFCIADRDRVRFTLPAQQHLEPVVLDADPGAQPAAVVTRGAIETATARNDELTRKKLKRALKHALWAAGIFAKLHMDQKARQAFALARRGLRRTRRRPSRAKVGSAEDKAAERETGNGLLR